MPSTRKSWLGVGVVAIGFALIAAASASAQVKESNGGPPNLDTGYRAATQERTSRLNAVSAVTDETLRHPADGDWLGWRRTNAALGFSPLSQVDTHNAHALAVSWAWTLPTSPNEITPLVHDGVLYIASADRVQALDGASGDLLWEYISPTAGRTALLRPASTSTISARSVRGRPSIPGPATSTAIRWAYVRSRSP